ncbi:MAG: CAP domain-containing protein [Cyanobacteria bacterium REEB459]|nr:CAP domain-containing protein [Cyanobacteria bacterium REEB459]
MASSILFPWGLVVVTLGLLPWSCRPLTPIGNRPSLPQASAAAPDWRRLAQDILLEQNRVRQNPASYIPLLQARLASMDSQGQISQGCGPNCRIITQEGPMAVREAISALARQPAAAPLQFSTAVAQAAQAHAQDQAQGRVGHQGSDGSDPGQRLTRAGVPYTRAGENIAYGSRTGQQVLLDLIVDDGVPNRGHRTAIFSPAWSHTGAGCGPHRNYGSVCVINYAHISQQLQVINQGRVALQSLQVAGRNILGTALPPGQTRQINLEAGQCQAPVRVDLGPGYLPLDLPSLNLCGAKLSLTGELGLTVSY